MRGQRPVRPVCTRANIQLCFVFGFAPCLAGQGQEPASQPAPQQAPSQNATPEIPAPKQTDDFLRLRMEWFYQQRAFPLGYIPAGSRLAALRQREAMVNSQRRAGVLPQQAVPNATS